MYYTGGFCCIFQSTLGANPIAVAAPAKDGDSFVLDMSTTTVAAGKVSVFTISHSKKLLCIYIYQTPSPETFKGQH